jgi:hypothetical protein
MRGWPIVGWAALGVGVMVAAVSGAAGTDDAGLRAAIRATARSSAALFALAFAAAAGIRRRWRSPVSAWLLANRRYLGVSFAVSHFVHLLLILALVGWTFEGLLAEGGVVGVLFGGIGYGFLAAMTATSFDRTAAWLGPRAWRRLHLTGAWYLWGIFLITFGPNAGRSAPAALFTVVLLAVLVLRLQRTSAA